MGGPGSIGNRQAAPLIGVAPFARDSGGRRRPRDVLYMAAMTACLFNPDMKEMCGRLRDKGKCHRVALAAVMRKLTVTANALLRDRRAWEDRTGQVRKVLDILEGRASVSGLLSESDGPAASRGPTVSARPDVDRNVGNCGKPVSGHPEIAEKDRIRA